MKNRKALFSLKLALIVISVIFLIINGYIFWNIKKPNQDQPIEKIADFESKKNILILYSYSPAFDTYPMLIEGLLHTENWLLVQ